MKSKIKIVLSIVIPITAIGGILVYNNISRAPQGAQQPPKTEQTRNAKGNRSVPVEIYVANYVNLDEGIKAVGTLLANEEVDIASETMGKVERINFDEGSAVRRGDLLVKVNDADLQSQLKRANFQSNMLKDKLERNRILLDKEAVSREAFDQIETDYNMVEADIQLLKVRLDKTEIRAPFDGVIGFRYISVGSYIQPSTQVARMVDRSRLKIEFSMPEKYHRTAQVGSKVSFTTEGDKHVYRAAIYAIDPKVDSKTRTVTMRALFDNSAAGLLPGMFAAVTVGQKSGSAIQIPTEAIVPDMDQKKVWLVENGKAISVPVTTGIRGENLVEVTHGINVGDTVIVTGLLQIKENSPVQIVEK